MNARVGNPSAALIDPHLVMQLVGPIPGVAPVPARNQQQQQYPVQGERGLNLPVVVYLIPIQGPVDKRDNPRRHNHRKATSDRPYRDVKSRTSRSPSSQCLMHRDSRNLDPAHRCQIINKVRQETACLGMSVREPGAVHRHSGQELGQSHFRTRDLDVDSRAVAAKGGLVSAVTGDRPVLSGLMDF